MSDREARSFDSVPSRLIGIGVDTAKNLMASSRRPQPLVLLLELGNTSHLPTHDVLGLVELRLDAVRDHGRILSRRRGFTELLLSRHKHINETAMTITCILICRQLAGR